MAEVNKKYFLISKENEKVEVSEVVIRESVVLQEMAGMFIIYLFLNCSHFMF